MERVGEIYRALQSRFDPAELEVTVVDRRNTVWLLPAIWRDGRRRGMPVRARLRQLSRATTPCTVVCDGLVVAQDTTPERAVAAVEEDMAARTVSR
jgi:hypothetical protein